MTVPLCMASVPCRAETRAVGAVLSWLQAGRLEETRSAIPPAKASEHVKRFDFFFIPFVMDLAIAMSQLMSNFRALDLGASAVTVGVLIGLGFGAPYVIGSAATGRTLPRFGARSTMTVGSALFALGVGLTGFAQAPWMLVAAAPLAGLGSGLFWPAFQTCLASETHAETRARASIFNVSWTLGILSGGALGGHFYRIAGPQRSFWWVAALIGALTAVIWVRARSNARQLDGAGSAEAGFDAPERVAAAYRWMAWAANGALWVAASAAAAIFPRMARDLGFSDGTIGEIAAVTWVGQAVLFAVLASGPWWQYRKAPLVLGLAGCMGAMALLGGGAGAAAFVGAFALIGASRGPTQAASVHYSLHSGARSGANMGYHEAILGLGCVVGPLLAGALADRWGVRAPFAMGGAVVLAAMALVAAMRVEASPAQVRAAANPEIVD